MVNYRRNLLPGGTYFFTVTLKHRGSTTLVDQVLLLKRAHREVQKKHPFTVTAICVLPDHLHAIWTLPTDDADYPRRWQAIKSIFTRLCVHHGLPFKKNKKDEYDLWQRRYWEHTIVDEEDLQRHIDYLHYNPVKHAYVKQVADWPHSSFHQYVKSGILPLDWAGAVDTPDDKGQYGE